MMNKYLPLRILLAVSFLICGVALADSDELASTINSLPALRNKLEGEAKTVSERGDMASLVAGPEAITKGLLPHLIKIESKYRKISQDEASEMIRRDLQAVGRDIEVRYPDGGTMEFLDRANAVAGHVIRRINWCVSQLMSGQKDFNLADWRLRWEAKGEQDGAANGSQPIRSETNRTSSAAGSRR